MTSTVKKSLRNSLKISTLTLAVCSLFLAVAPVVAQDVRSVTNNGTVYSIKALADVYSDKSGEVAEDQARIVFYRTQNATKNNAATVYVNGMYHASIVAGGFSPICLKPGTTEVSVREMKLVNGSKDGYDSSTTVNTQAGKTTYVQVRETGYDRWTLQTVPELQAEEELKGDKLQVHTISRVVGAEACKASDKARIQLAGDTLFKFARSDRAALTGKGTAALDSVATQLHQQYRQINSLAVIGYADPLGNPVGNQKLSDQRAKTVLQYLNEKGVKAANESAVGKGSQDLVVTNCGKTATPQSIACNLPNRRVVIDVSGIRK